MAKKRSNKKLLGLILVAAFTFYQCLHLYKDIKATSWPFVEGKIHWQTKSAGPFRNERRGYIIGSLHWKEVQFSYNVNESQYSSNNLSYGLTFSDVSELANPYDKDQSTVKVYFNPFSPSEAVLMPGPKAINVCFVVLGALSLFWLLRRIIRD